MTVVPDTFESEACEGADCEMTEIAVSTGLHKHGRDIETETDHVFKGALEDTAWSTL